VEITIVHIPALTMMKDAATGHQFELDSSLADVEDHGTEGELTT
jgi:hypothetical protein